MELCGNLSSELISFITVQAIGRMFLVIWAVLSTLLGNLGDSRFGPYFLVSRSEYEISSIIAKVKQTWISDNKFSTTVKTRARKYHAIRENSRGKWPTVSSSFTTFTACLSIGLFRFLVSRYLYLLLVNILFSFVKYSLHKASICLLVSFSGVQTSLVK